MRGGRGLTVLPFPFTLINSVKAKLEWGPERSQKNRPMEVLVIL